MQTISNEISTIRLRKYNPALLRISIFARYNYLTYFPHKEKIFNNRS